MKKKRKQEAGERDTTRAEIVTDHTYFFIQFIVLIDTNSNDEGETEKFFLEQYCLVYGFCLMKQRSTR